MPSGGVCDMCDHQHEPGFLCAAVIDPVEGDTCVCFGRRYTRGIMPKFGAIASPRHGKTEALKRAEERSWAQLLNNRLDALEKKQDAILAILQDLRHKLA